MNRSRAFRSTLTGSRFSLGKRIGAFPFHYYALIGLLGVAALVGAQTPANTGYDGLPQSPRSTPPATTTAPQPAAATMDQAMQLAAAAQQSFQTVRDYTSLMIKQERIQGRLEPENVMEIKIRHQPFSVYLRWLGPSGLAGQEACYVAGRNNNMMRVHPTGFKGAFGFLSIAADDPRVMEHSRHKITEAGLGNLIQRLNTCWELDRRQNSAQVQIADYEYNKRKCARAEIVRPTRSTGPCAFYRTVAYFDKETHLPVRVELYDWPRTGGTAGGDLVESYSYVNTRFNMGLTDSVFER